MKINVNEFATQWITSWNSHNLEGILSHYAEDIEVTSPKIRLILKIEQDSLKGKEAVRNYWKKALLQNPDLHFTLIDLAFGIDSISIYYKSTIGKMAIEVMFFDEQGKVNKMFAHYT